MKAYELLFFINPALDENDRAAVTARVSEIIAASDGTVESFEEWGAKRKLAYEIQDLSEGQYYLVNFQANPESVSEIDRLLRISDRIIRYIITRREVEAVVE